MSQSHQVSRKHVSRKVRRAQEKENDYLSFLVSRYSTYKEREPDDIEGIAALYIKFNAKWK